jgi:hypothetical protein
MENFDEIKSIWKNEPNGLISSDIIIDNIIKQHMRKKQKKNIINSILLFVLLLILIYLIGFASFQMWTTYLGLSVFFIVTFYIIYLRGKRYSKSSNIDFLDNNEFLSTLEKEKNETCIGKKKQQTSLFIFYAIGFGLYIYETASQSTTSLIIGYGALIIYLLAAKFFYFPFIAKRNQSKTNEIIKKINSLRHQFKENE